MNNRPGLIPARRREIYDIHEELKKENKTILLTTIISKKMKSLKNNFLLAENDVDRSRV